MDGPSKLDTDKTPRKVSKTMSTEVTIGQGVSGVNSKSVSFHSGHLRAEGIGQWAMIGEGEECGNYAWLRVITLHVDGWGGVPSPGSCVTCHVSSEVSQIGNVDVCVNVDIQSHPVR